MKRPRLFSVVIYSVVGVLVALAGVMTWNYLQATTTGEAVPSLKVVTVSTEEPSERTPPPVESTGEYTVPATHPRALFIDSLAISGFVQPVSIDQHGQIAVPTNVHFAGWYVKSAHPGQNGVTIIDGHVGGRYGGAIFSKLSELKKGDVIRLQTGDLSLLTYHVEKNDRIRPDNSPALFAKYTTAKNELHLVTCDGVYIPKDKTYDQRSLIVARLVR